MMKKKFILKLFLVGSCVCFGSVMIYGAEIKMLKVGSWATYKMESKTEMPASMTGGAGGMQGLDPKMLAMMPPAQRAKIEAQMKAAGGGAGGAGGMSASGVTDMASDMMKDLNMKMKYSVVGEETRDGKPYVWLEIFFQANLPDFNKMMTKMEPMLKGLSAAQANDMKKKMAEAEKKMKEMSLATKDGKMKFIMKMLIDKPDENTGFFATIKPIEIIQKEGDNAPVKLGQEEIEGFGKGESSEKRKDSSSMESEMKANFDSGHLGGNKAEGTSVAAGKMNQAAKLGAAVGKIPGVQAIPGAGQAVAALQLANEATSVVSDIMNLKIKGSMEAKTKVETEAESETTTKLVSKESEAIGMENIQVVSVGEVPALHFQTKEVRETVSKTKITKMDMDVKASADVGVGVEGGAQSKTGKVVGALGKISDPFGTKKKQQQQATDNMMKGISEGTKKGIEGTEFGAKTQYESMQDMWLSPQVPALGMAKLVQSSQQKGGPETSVGGGTMGAAYGQQHAAMQNKMMAGKEQPKTTMTFSIETMGDSGAKSEIR